MATIPMATVPMARTGQVSWASAGTDIVADEKLRESPWGLRPGQAVTGSRWPSWSHRGILTLPVLQGTGLGVGISPNTS